MNSDIRIFARVGLRGSTQVRIYSYAWVRIPQDASITFANLFYYHHLFGLNYFGRIHTAALLDNQLYFSTIVKHKINKHTHNGRRRKTTTNGNTTDSIHMQYNRMHTMTTKRLLRLLASIRVLCVVWLTSS